MALFKEARAGLMLTDGYHDATAGKLAMVVTHLEKMRERRALAAM